MSILNLKDSDSKKDAVLLEKAKDKKRQIEPIIYDTFIMVSASFKEQLFAISEKIWNAKIYNWNGGEAEWTACYDKLKSLISDELGLAQVVTELALGFSCYVPKVTWLDEIAEAIKHCITGSNHAISMCNNFPPNQHAEKLRNCNTLVPCLVNFLRHMNYALGNIACQLIQRNYGEENDSANEQLKKLNILQGGIELRHIPTLSREAKLQIEGSFKITKD